MDKFIIINKYEDLKDKLFYVDKKTKLTFRPGPTCQELDVRVKTNYPVTKNSKFERKTYHQLTVASDHQDSISSLFNWSTSLRLEIAGTFHFVCESGSILIWDAYVIVKPEIKIPLGSIRSQTLLSKCLGPLSEWRKRLAITKEAGYNMIHLTPIQELGASNSAYSIRHQHKVNPMFKATLDDIKKEVDYMDKKWGMLTLTDIVLNHTANDSQWIREHPECAYNMANSKHLRPAFMLDSAFIWLAKDIMAGYMEHTDNLTINIKDENDVRTIGVLLKTFYVPQLKIYEMFLVNVTQTVAKFSQIKKAQELVINHKDYQRHGSEVEYMPHWIASAEELRSELVKYNYTKKEEIKSWLNYAIDNALSALRYERLNEHGCYYKQPISPEAPLVAPYFTHTSYDKFTVVDEEKLMYDKGDQFMAHNGWVMGYSSSFVDFASNESNVYLKRELIAWGDSVKLRYGSGPEEVPHLWSHMKKYVESQAKVFHGFRLDNCHSTPLNVAEFVVDTARAIRPDIYIMAELFTSSESTDNIFVNRLGITSLVRESMSAHNCQELGRLIYRFGGTPVGAFSQPDGVEPLKPQTAMAIFYDQTHDNDTPILKKSIYDLIPTTSAINMANCATGSTRGYDELIPHHINVVTESRLYATSDDIKKPAEVGLVPLRRILNVDLLQNLKGFDEIFVDQVNEDVIAITRHNPMDGRSIVLIARTAFTNEQKDCPMRSIELEGIVSRTIFEALGFGHINEFVKNEKYINGLTTFAIKLFDGDTKLTDVNNFIDKARIGLNQFKFLPSSVTALEIRLSEGQTKALNYLNSWVEPSLANISLNDANFILFRCPEEDGWQTYEIPGFCKFTYSGLYGLMYHLQKVSENQDQAHPLAENLRQGNWLGQFIVTRLMSRPTLTLIAERLEKAFEQVELLPRGMVPKYFHKIVAKLYTAVVNHVYSNMSSFVKEGPKLVKLLALSSVALVGECDSAPLPSLMESKLIPPSIAAGLPHFASGFMRNWGRDTFIALRGLLLVTGRYNDAKNIILAYARTLKHGLIPNLLDGGVNSRYNCRDAIWWWLYSIREYTKFAPNGSDILKCKVKRIHKPERLGNGTPQRKRSTAQTNGLPDDSAYVQMLYDLIQESLECHFKGVKFIEERAGKQLDEHMKTEGFEVSFGVDRETGFVFGGNEWNCGTWMDKMGSSLKAGTKGKPASPRDGSAVEIVGLSKAVISWLDDAHKNRAYPYDGVECLYDNTITLKWTWKKWASLIQNNFEKHFYVPVEPVQCIESELINKRGIYKDSVNATIRWQDYQLRPNFLVTMVVAPELFDREHARRAILMAKRNLCGPVGMRTLDPSDFNYRPDYVNSDDSDDPKIANGFNYHQGPEWLWLTGYYIRASSKFFGAQERSHHLELLSNLYLKLEESAWLGLPELTNLNGNFCPDSCTIQAWSLGTTLEALYESIRNA